MTRPRALGPCAELMLAALMVAALAQPAAAQLTALVWSAPASCPTASSVERRVAELVESAGVLRAEVRAYARVALRRPAKARSYVLTLTVDAPDYHAARTLEARQCATLADAAAWLIAVALAPGFARVEPKDSAAAVGLGTASRSAASTSEAPASAASSDRNGSGAAVEANDREPREVEARERASETRGAANEREQPAVVAPEPAAEAPESASPAPVSEPREPDTAVDPRPGSPLPRWWRAGVSAGVLAAGLPSAAATLGAQAGLGLGALLLELRASWQPSRTRVLSARERASFGTQLLGAALCGQWGVRLRAGPCMGIDLLRTTARISGVTEARAQALLWAGLGPSLQVSYGTNRWLELQGELGALLPISPRPRFTVEGLGEVARAWPLTVYARVGLGIRPPAAARLER